MSQPKISCRSRVCCKVFGFIAVLAVWGMLVG